MVGAPFHSDIGLRREGSFLWRSRGVRRMAGTDRQMQCGLSDHPSTHTLFSTVSVHPALIPISLSV